jgi:hypothetical protein
MSGISSSQRASTPLLNPRNTEIQNSHSMRDVEEDNGVIFNAACRPRSLPLVVVNIAATAVTSAYLFYVLAAISKTPSTSEAADYEKTAKTLAIASTVAIVVQSTATGVFLSAPSEELIEVNGSILPKKISFRAAFW